MVEISTLNFYQKQNSIFLIHKWIIRLVYIETSGCEV